MSQLWLSLEQFWGLSNSRLSWQLRLGDAEIGRHDLLVPTNQLAKSLPVAGNPHEWLEVSEFEDGVFEGYNEKTEEYEPVDRRAPRTERSLQQVSVCRMTKTRSK